MMKGNDMNEQMQQALATLITKAVSGAEAIAHFGAEQIPDVLQQLLIWKAVESGLFFCVGVAIVLSVFWFLFLLPSKARRDYEDGKKWTRFGGRDIDSTSSEYDMCMDSSIRTMLCVIPLF